MVLPLVILAVLCLAMGIGYMVIESQLLDPAASALLDKVAYMNYLIGG
jgi:formate hydrogenlyase subunit 3/multisubunit Na+/H+ antiporter MnhD subunit